MQRTISSSYKQISCHALGIGLLSLLGCTISDSAHQVDSPASLLDGQPTPAESEDDGFRIEPVFDDSKVNTLRPTTSASRSSGSSSTTSTDQENTVVIRGQSPTPQTNAVADNTSTSNGVASADFVELGNPSQVLRIDDQSSNVTQASLQQSPLAPNDDSVSPLFDPNANLNSVPFDVFVEEGRTGRFVFGVGVNSDAGVTGTIVIDERNFDYEAIPRNWDDFIEGRAFRGGGQGFRLEAMPGQNWSRYMLQYSNPYFNDTKVSFNTSAFMYDRIYQDWNENRIGGRFSFGYRLTPDLSINAALRIEQVGIDNPSTLGVPALDEALGDNNLVGFRLGLKHDTRDTPFLATEGHYFSTSVEQVVGSFDYTRGSIEYRKYNLIRERADGSGRHVLSWALQLDLTGENTPIYDHYYAGGYQTIRGFRYRGASPVTGGVQTGGHMRFLGSVQYMFPFTADDMLRGVVFTDFGTVEEQYSIQSDDFRVVVGAGLRIAVPFMSQAPFALDFG
ncbi:MAG: BamA/TamA family outer membrane protein, partial [Pirellulaceae bacterium]|nr:BamA/TamA family outer membrane protein [Pirellulaceae bacterium]